MSKFLAAVRKLFTRNAENKMEPPEEAEANHQPNEFQQVKKKPREYEEVDIGKDGTTEVKTDKVILPSNVQEPPPRAPHSYEVVELPGTEGGKVEIR